MSHTNFNLNFTILLENSKLWALTEGQKFELFKPVRGVFSPEVFRPKSELSASEALIRTLKFEILIWTFQF